MVKLHKVWGNLMVDVQATNAKLVRRTVMLTMRATGCDEDTARDALAKCEQSVKWAIVVIKLGVTPELAKARLDAAQGSVRAALGA